jgi:hypothetical protein
MWKLPNGKITCSPRSITVGDVQYSTSIFHRWTPAELKAIGIFRFREVQYDIKYYKSTGSTDVEIGDEIVRTHTITQRFTAAELKDIFARLIKQNLRQKWIYAQEEHEYLLMFEPLNQTDITIWVQYKADLRSAAQTIKTAFQALTSYEDGITFIKETYPTMLPDTPGETIVST